MYNPYPNSPYSTLGNSRNQFAQSQQQQYDFSGWGDRLTSIEEGIKGLTENFKNINIPGEEFGEQSSAPEAEYAGNTAPPPLAAAPPAGGIPSIPITPGAIDTGAEMIANVDPLAPTTPSAPPVMPMGEQIGSGQPKPPLPPGVVGGDFLQPKPSPMMHSGEQPKPPPPTSMADWLQDYEFDLAPSRPEWQPGQNIQDIMQAHTNSPEYQAWQEREEERGPLSQSTMDAMRGGYSYSSNAGNSIDPYIRGGGDSYEDYLSTHEKMKEARPQIEELRQNWQGNQSQSMIDQMNAIYQSVGLGPGSGLAGPGGLGVSGGQGQALRQQIQYDPTKMMGGENWNPLGQEEYERQYDLWGSHMNYKDFSQAAANQLQQGGRDTSMYKMGANPMFGHAYEAWNQFNQSQPGGPYTDPNQSRSEFENIPMSALDPVRDAEQIASMNKQTASLNNPPRPALGGPLQQKIQQGLGSLAA